MKQLAKSPFNGEVPSHNKDALSADEVPNTNSVETQTGGVTNPAKRAAASQTEQQNQPGTQSAGKQSGNGKKSKKADDI